nr:MAG TPA: hypothetical protein [Caudoviricetes sp.]
MCESPKFMTNRIDSPPKFSAGIATKIENL